MERIKQMTKEREINHTNRTNIHEPPAVELPTLRGSLKIFVEERMDNSKFGVRFHFCFVMFCGIKTCTNLSQLNKVLDNVLFLNIGLTVFHYSYQHRNFDTEIAFS